MLLHLNPPSGGIMSVIGFSFRTASSTNSSWMNCTNGAFP